MLWLALVPAPAAQVATWDKANHLVAFGVLGLLGAAAWPQRRTRTFFLLLGYGGAIEVLQSFTPTRQSDWQDLVADAMGLLLALLVSRWVDPAREASHRR